MHLNPLPKPYTLPPLPPGQAWVLWKCLSVPLKPVPSTRTDRLQRGQAGRTGMPGNPKNCTWEQLHPQIDCTGQSSIIERSLSQTTHKGIPHEHQTVCSHNSQSADFPTIPLPRIRWTKLEALPSQFEARVCQVAVMQGRQLCLKERVTQVIQVHCQSIHADLSPTNSLRVAVKAIPVTDVTLKQKRCRFCPDGAGQRAQVRSEI